VHHDRLKNAVLPNVLGEFVEPRFRELGTRVVAVLVQALDGDEKCLAGHDIGCRDFARGREGWRSDSTRIRAGFRKWNEIGGRGRCRVKQIQLLALRFDPRYAHGGIVPRLAAAR
jgi:hypothetical protein